MSDNRYRVVTTGKQLIDDIHQIHQQISAIFDLPEQQLNLLTSGQALIIKEQITASNAMQFKKALTKCGLGCLVEPMNEASIVNATRLQSLHNTEQAQDKPAVTKELITKEPITQSIASTASPAPAKTEFLMAPAGARIGPRPSVSKHVLPSTDHLTADFAERLAPVKEAAPAPLKVDHISLGAVGEIIGVAKAKGPTPPDVSHIKVSEVGATLSQPKTVPPLKLDLSHIRLDDAAKP